MTLSPPSCAAKRSASIASSSTAPRRAGRANARRVQCHPLIRQLAQTGQADRYCVGRYRLQFQVWLRRHDRLVCIIDGKTFIIDFKTSKQVWPEYELQVSAYKKPIETAEFNIEGLNDVAAINLAILQIGYTRNKAGYKFTEVEDQFLLFLAARQIWQKESAGQAPSMREYPIVISPAVSVEEAMGVTEEDLDASIDALVSEEPAQVELPVGRKTAKIK
jgi:hypothetical protein